MKKNLYEKPAIRVVEFEQRMMLLTESNPSGGMIPGNDPYIPGDNPFNF